MYIKEKNRRNNGITLISLVITIIIMLILVGVSITLAVNGGLFEYAGNAVGETRNAMENEQWLIENIINDYIKPNTGEVIIGNNGERFSALYQETKEYTDTNGDTAVIPKGFAVGTTEGINKIENGLVIRDKDGNEFVWVPCTTDKENTSVTQYAKDTKYNVGDTDDTSKQWQYKAYTDWADKGKNETSVTKNGGFYVARYEAGIPENADFYPDTKNLIYTFYKDENEEESVRNTTEYVPVSKKNNPSWNGISQKNAVIVSEKMYEGSASVTSSLIDSYAWDTIVNWMESKVTGIATNSTTYGNYVNSGMTLTDVSYAKHVINYNGGSNWQWGSTASKYTKGDLTTTKRSTTGTEDVEIYELATGSTESAKVLNIYDMAGNMWEWTTETGDHNDGSNDGSYAVRRGGGFDDVGNFATVAGRHGTISDNIYRSVGFRVVVYVK